MEKIEINVYYYNKSGSEQKSEQNFKGYKSLYNKINDFTKLSKIVVYPENRKVFAVIGHYNIIDFLKRNC